MCLPYSKQLNSSKSRHPFRMFGTDSQNVSNSDMGKSESAECEDPNFASENILSNLNSPRTVNTLSSQRHRTKTKGATVHTRLGQCDKENHSSGRGTTTRKRSTKPATLKEGIAKNEELQTDRSHHSSIQRFQQGLHNQSCSNLLEHPNSTTSIVEQTAIIPEEDSAKKDNESNSHRVELESSGLSEGNYNTSQLKISDLNSSTSGMKKKYNDSCRTIEDRMRQSEMQSERIVIERDRLQVELDRLILELKQTKMGWALAEERKEEVELSLKTEIKYLISKLMQQKGVCSSDIQKELTQLLKDLNRNMYNPSSFVNTSGILNCSCLNQFSYRASSQNEHLNTSVVSGTYDSKHKQNEHTSKSTRPNNNLSMNMESKENDGKTDCLYQFDDHSLNSSPHKLNEFHENENSLLQNIANTNNNPKKLIKYIQA